MASLEREEPELQNASELFDELLDGDITEGEIRQALQSLKHGKADGPDGLVNEILISVSETIVAFLTKVFNKILQAGEYPQKWTKAVIAPVHTERRHGYSKQLPGNFAVKCH